MKQNSMTFAGVLIGVLAGAQIVAAVTADNPYTSTITNRNLFGLKPPPDPASLIPPPPPVNVPKVMLTGLTTLMGGKRCILRVPVPARGQSPAKEISLFKAEQDSMEEGVQVLEIDLATARVKINNNGTMQTLDLAKDAPKSAGSAPTGAPGLPASPGALIPAPGGVPAPALSSSRPMRGSTGNPTASVVGGGPSQIVAAPTAPLPLPPSREEQMVLIEANRLQEPTLPFPPTELQEIMQQEQQGSGGSPVSPVR